MRIHARQLSRGRKPREHVSVQPDHTLTDHGESRPMSHGPTQNMDNHVRYVPLFHFVAVPILLVNFIYGIYTLVIAVRNPGPNHAAGILDNVINLLLAFALIVIAFAGRVFALSVQDRVIRLEEQQRFERLLPADLRSRIPEFTREQFVALRFASDAELPALARTVLDQRIHDRAAIKQMVKEWRGDYLRA